MKIVNALSGTSRVVVSLSPLVHQSLAEIKSLIMNVVTYDRELVEPFLPSSKSLAMLAAEIADCTSCAELFDVLEIPGPDHVLDVL